jgi:molybdate transport system substrate-binding protein
MRRIRVYLAYCTAVAVLAVAGAGCAATTTQRTTSSSAAGGHLTVFAAASLQHVFTELATEFEQRHPGTNVRLNFAGSSDLAAQILAGAPADVFASADPGPVAQLGREHMLSGTPVPFASNTLVIAVQPGNPHRIDSLADLAGPGLDVVLCAPQGTCGSAAAHAQAAAGVTVRPVSEERSVTDVLGRVTSGEADAGLVYVTDVRSAGDRVEAVEFSQARTAVNTYPAAVLSASAEPKLAEAFVHLLASPSGAKILDDAGFAEPSQ